MTAYLAPPSESLKTLPWTESSSAAASALEGRIPISGRQECGADLDALRAAHRRAADAAQPAAARRRRQLQPPAQPARRLDHGRGRPAGRVRPGDDASRVRHRLDHRALRHRPQDARLDPGARAAARPRRRGDGVAARRLRDRQPADRPASARRSQALGAEIELAAGYVRATAPEGRADRRHDQLPLRVGRRDRECADGGGARQGHDRDRECRARAGDHRPRQMPGRDGRQDRAGSAPTR